MQVGWSAKRRSKRRRGLPRSRRRARASAQQERAENKTDVPEERPERSGESGREKRVLDLAAVWAGIEMASVPDSSPSTGKALHNA